MVVVVGVIPSMAWMDSIVILVFTFGIVENTMRYVYGLIFVLVATDVVMVLI